MSTNPSIHQSINPPAAAPFDIVWRHPNDLTVHPQVKHLHAWPDNDPRFKALVDDVKANGFLEATLITPDGQIVDVRHRHRVAKRLQIDLPCRIVSDDPQAVASLALSTVLHRKHYTPGQRAYVIAGIAEDAFRWSQKRSQLNLKSGPLNPQLAEGSAQNHPISLPDANSVGIGSLKTIQEWAQEAGISREYLRQAREVRQAIGVTHPDKKWRWNDSVILASLGHAPDAQLTFREYYEPQILREENPIGLGRVLAGIGARIQQEAAEKAGAVHGGGQPEEEAKQLRLFNDVWDTAANRWEYWANFDEPAKTAALDHVREIFAATPDDLRLSLTTTIIATMPDNDLKAIATALRSEKKRRKKQASRSPRTTGAPPVQPGAPARLSRSKKSTDK